MRYKVPGVHGTQALIPLHPDGSGRGSSTTGTIVYDFTRKNGGKTSLHPG
jgi:hypothetical protein